MTRSIQKHGLMLLGLALGLLLCSARPAEAALRDNRLGIFVEFPGKGAEVTGFLPGSPAARAGLHIGDHITKVEGHVVNNPEGYTARVGKAGKIVSIHVKRGKKDFTLKIGN